MALPKLPTLDLEKPVQTQEIPTCGPGTHLTWSAERGYYCASDEAQELELEPVEALAPEKLPTIPKPPTPKERDVEILAGLKEQKPELFPREDPSSLFKRVFPELISSEATEGLTSVEAITKRINENPQAFLTDLKQRVSPQDAELVLRQFGASEGDLDQIIGWQQRQASAQQLVSTIFPEQTLESLATLAETDWEQFVKELQAGGRSDEKVSLLQMMGGDKEFIDKLLPPEPWQQKWLRSYGVQEFLPGETKGPGKSPLAPPRPQRLGEMVKAREAGAQPFQPEPPSTVLAQYPPVGDQSIRAFIAGVGGLIGNAGSTARWLGFEQQGETLSSIGASLQNMAPPDTTGEFDLADLLNPDWYVQKVVPTIPFSLSIAPLALAGYIGGGALATAFGVSKIGAMLIGSGLAGVLSRGAESAMEAGQAYDDAIARGKSESEAKKEADETFRNNMILGGADAWEIFIALAPTPKWVPAALVKSNLVKVARVGGKMVIVGLSEGGEEVVQSMITRHARGEEWKLDPMDKEVFAIGAVMGLGMGLGGDVVTGVIERAKSRMSTALKGQFDQAVGEGKTELQALDVGARTPEGEKLLVQIISEFKTGVTPTLEVQAGIEGLAALGKGEMPEAIGRQTVAYGPDPSKAYQMQYKLVELEDLIPSHTDAFAPNPAYPSELQPRMRERGPARADVNKIAAKLVPEVLIQDSNMIDRGPPIIGSDNVVESGNGRVMALRMARDSYPERWQAYQQTLKEALPQFGFEERRVSQMQNPVLVRERVTDVDRVTFTSEANQPAVAVFSPLENALQDSKRIRFENLVVPDITQSLDTTLRTASNRPFIASFLETLSSNERNSLVDAAGELNLLGMQRIKAAMFARTYPGEAGRRLTRIFFESREPLIRNIEEGMLASLPKMARAEELVSNGQRQSGLSLAEDLGKSLDMLAVLRQRKLTVTQYLAQRQLFEKELTPFQEQLLQHIEGIANSPRKVREFLGAFADAVTASPHPQQGAMLAGGKITKEALFNDTLRRQKEGPLFAAQTETPTVSPAPAGEPGLVAEAPGVPQTPEVPAVAKLPVEPAGKEVPVAAAKESWIAQELAKVTVETPAMKAARLERQLLREILPKLSKAQQQELILQPPDFKELFLNRIGTLTSRNTFKKDMAEVRRLMEQRSELAPPEAPAVAKAPQPVVAAPVAKEPWQMTREEFRNWEFLVPSGGASKTPKRVMALKRGEDFETLSDYTRIGREFEFDEILGKGWEKSTGIPNSLKLKEAIRKGNKIKVYRASDVGDIVPGSYVSESRRYVQEHGETRIPGGKFQVYEMEVYPNELLVYGDPHEFIYVPRSVEEGHKRILQKALSEGKPVPDEVLKDYPDLAALTKPPTTAITDEVIANLGGIEGTKAKIAELEKSLTSPRVSLQRRIDNRNLITQLEQRLAKAIPKAETVAPVTPEVTVELQEGYKWTPATHKWLEDFKLYAQKVSEATNRREPNYPAVTAKDLALWEKDWKAFSRKMGYTEGEIADYAKYLQLTEEGKGLGVSEDSLMGVLYDIEQARAAIKAKPVATPEAEPVAEAKALIPSEPTEVVPPPIKPLPPAPMTATVPIPPGSPSELTRIITQSQEQVKQMKPGIFTRVLQHIPGARQVVEFERPGLKMTGENEKVLVAMVAKTQARNDIATRELGSRLPLFKKINELFGKDALHGGKVDIKFIGEPEAVGASIRNTLLDIANNPEWYDLSASQKQFLVDAETRNTESLAWVVDKYGAEIGRFTPKEGGWHLPNVDISEDILDYLGNETRAIARGRGKTRVWQTAGERMAHDKSFKPELDVRKLLEGMDSFKASAAGGITYREAIGGLTRLEMMKKTHPALYAKMTGLRKRLQSLKGSLARLDEKLSNAVEDFLNSPVEGQDLSDLHESLDVKLATGIRAGMNVEDIQAQIDSVRGEIKELRPMWEAANPKPYVFIQEGLFRYFPADQAKLILESLKITNNPVLRFIERWRGGAFSGDFSPFFIQGTIGVLADPIGNANAAYGSTKTAIEKHDLLRSWKLDALADDVAADPEGWAQFASLMGRQLAGTPEEYSAGFLSKIPGFDKFTEATYITVTRESKALWVRTTQKLLKAGTPELEAKVAAIKIVSEVYPLVNAATLGQSQARTAFLRALPTSYSFIRQPASLMAQATTGIGKIATRQKLTPQESVAVKTMLTMSSSILIVSATSAAISALSKGEDDDKVLQAILDAINPDPYNGKFASIIIGNVRIPLGGPYRAIFRALYPQDVKGIPFPVPFAGLPQFLRNRITPAIRTQLDLLLNKDYSKQQIIKGQFPENIIRGLLYELEEALPLSLGTLAEDIRNNLGNTEFRDKKFWEIRNDVSGQFMGVNVITLDNTYFDRLIRQLGQPDLRKPQEPLSIEKPVFTTKDIWGDVRRALKDATAAELEKRRLPPLVKHIVATGLVKDQVDLIRDHKLAGLNTDPAKGDTFIQFYEQWKERQKLLGDEKKLAEFDKLYPNANLGNMSAREYDALVKYVALKEVDKAKAAEWLKSHPELILNPRTDWLKSHPKENAQLAVWGQAKILTPEAYKEVQRLIKELDIPDAAVPKFTLPPEKSVESYFKYQDMLAEGKGDSPGAQLMLAKDDDLRKFLEREPIKKPVASLELRVKNQANYDKLASYSNRDSPDFISNEKSRAEAVKKLKADNPGWVDDMRRIEAIEHKGEALAESWVERGKIADKAPGFNAEEKLWLTENPSVHKWALENKFLTASGETWNIPVLKIDVKYRKEDAAYNALPITGTARDDYLAANPEYRKDRQRRKAYQLTGFPTTEVENFVQYHELASKGYRQERLLLENPNFANAMMASKAITKLPDASKIPPVEYDEILEKYAPEFEKLAQATTKAEQDALRFDAKGKPTDFKIAELHLEAYKKTPQMVNEYVTYYTLPKAGYRQERFLLENPEFAKSVGLLIPEKVPSEQYDVLLEKENKTPQDKLAMEAYKLYVPDKSVNDYVGYYSILNAGKPPGQTLWYEDDWWMMEHQDFYRDVYLGILKKERKDYRTVPTREVFAKYQRYDKLTTTKEREAYRRGNRDLDSWLMLKFGLKPVGEEKTPAPPKPPKAQKLTSSAQRLASLRERLAVLGVK